MQDLHLPDFRRYAVDVPKPGTVRAEATRVLGSFLRDVMSMNMETRNFRVVGPDETNSNRLNALFEVTDRTWEAATIPIDDHMAPDGRVMEVLSEHMCQGWLGISAFAEPIGRIWIVARSFQFCHKGQRDQGAKGSRTIFLPFVPWPPCS